MTSRQRLLSAMRFEKVDRVPVAPFTLGALDADSEAAAELIRRTDPFIATGVAGDYFYGKACPRESQQEGDTTTIIRHTPLGDLVERHRRTEVTSACVEFAFKGMEDVERFLSVQYEPPDLDPSTFLGWKERIGEEGMVLSGLSDAVMLPALMLSPEDFCLWWADCPDVMTELTNTASRRLNDWVDRLCKAGVDAFRIVGGEYASVQLGPRGFDALVLEQDRELVSIIHSHGAIAYYHNHGPTMGFVSRFAHIGMDALDPLEAPPWGDADLHVARETCGESVAFVGNLDDMEIIDKLDQETVVRMALERLDQAGDRGFILGGTASGTYTQRAARNFIAIADALTKRV